MSCIYECRNSGLCSISTDSDEQPIVNQMERGCDAEAVCIVGDDPDPSMNCDGYESDNTCSECGIDLNVDDCDCD